MPISDADAKAFAQAYREAEKTRVPVDPIGQAHPHLTVDDAYRIQDALVEMMKADGLTPFGIKVGSTSKAAQRRFKTTEPVIGVLFLQRQIANGGAIDTARLIQPRVECEIAVRMGADLKGPGVTSEAAAAAIGSIMGAFEIIDSRTKDWRIKGVELIADNAVNAGFVLGPERPAHPNRGASFDARGDSPAHPDRGASFDARGDSPAHPDRGASFDARGDSPARDMDAAGISVLFGREGDPPTYGTGGSVLGGPKFVIAWLADWMGRRGKTLKAGTVVLTGSLSEILPAAKGQRFAAKFDPVGDVSVRFE
ncbi:MAG: hypothetical protein FJX42_00250 [Alphaproteobacteria bacterium]|nr:hypothetical protein [Alphaproteobacteria bacterium]